MKRLALIDADSIAYILGWINKDSVGDDSLPNLTNIYAQVSSLVTGILNMVNADCYILALSVKSFRHDVYRYKPYKGNRGEPVESIVFWKPFINKYLVEHWKAVTIPLMEADDIICKAAEDYQDMTCIIASPDKDLNQIPGIHFNYAPKKDTTLQEYVVTNEQADIYFWSQMLCGDTTDNIAGVPQLGDKKVKALMALWDDPIEREIGVKNEYVKYFGHYYGGIIYRETLATVELMNTRHPLWPAHASTFARECSSMRFNSYTREQIINKSLLVELGWAL